MYFIIMNTTNTGRFAEETAANYLKEYGYNIIENNWRTRWCEIDLVAEKDKVIFFVEVKYRKSSVWGGGLEAITSKKVEQMRFAAEMWVQVNDFKGDYRLLAIAVEGQPPCVVEAVEL